MEGTDPKLYVHTPENKKFELSLHMGNNIIKNSLKEYIFSIGIAMKVGVPNEAVYLFS